MRARLALASVVLVAGCVAAALAADQWDRVYLNNGDVVEGRIEEARQGKFWITTPAGDLVSVPFQDVAKVLRAHPEPTAPVTAPAMPEPKPVPVQTMPYQPPPPPRDPDEPMVGGGIYVGSVSGGRMRFKVHSPAIHHVDLRVGLGLFMDYAGSVYALAGLGPELGFFEYSRFHLAIGFMVGKELEWGYNFFTTGAAVQFDPAGPVELHLGAQLGIMGYYPGILPDVSVAFVW